MIQVFFLLSLILYLTSFTRKNKTVKKLYSIWKFVHLLLPRMTIYKWRWNDVVLKCRGSGATWDWRNNTDACKRALALGKKRAGLRRLPVAALKQSEWPHAQIEHFIAHFQKLMSPPSDLQQRKIEYVSKKLEKWKSP